MEHGRPAFAAGRVGAHRQELKDMRQGTRARDDGSVAVGGLLQSKSPAWSYPFFLGSIRPSCSSLQRGHIFLERMGLASACPRHKRRKRKTFRSVWSWPEMARNTSPSRLRSQAERSECQARRALSRRGRGQSNQVEEQFMSFVVRTVHVLGNGPAIFKTFGCRLDLDIPS